MKKYDIIFLGSGPGGYVGAIRAAQLGMKPLVVEKAELGGVCLNWGCIPTKALLRSSHFYSDLKNSKRLGITIEGTTSANLSKIVDRSRRTAAKMSKGVAFLFKKNGVDLLQGTGKIVNSSIVEVETKNGKEQVIANHIIIATGARPKELPGVPIDEKYVISYRKALVPDTLPESLLIIGSGAIGTEMAFFYSSLGTKVTVVEYFPKVVPLEDEEVSDTLLESLKKRRIEVITSGKVTNVEIKNDICTVFIETPKGTIKKEVKQVLSAAGIQANIDNIGLENTNVKIDKGKIVVDEYYRTTEKGIYAIGDVINTPALAHVASAEAILCVEKIVGLDVSPLDYSSIPSAIFSSPEIASLGITEQQSLKNGFDIKTGKFPFSALGKASAYGYLEGFVKLIFDKETDLLIGAHIIGEGASDMISELVIAKRLKAKSEDIRNEIHTHTTMSEAIMEAAADAHNEAIHL